MSRNARCILPGLAYHVTQRGTNRQKGLLFHRAPQDLSRTARTKLSGRGSPRAGLLPNVQPRAPGGRSRARRFSRRPVPPRPRSLCAGSQRRPRAHRAFVVKPLLFVSFIGAPFVDRATLCGSQPGPRRRRRSSRSITAGRVLPVHLGDRPRERSSALDIAFWERSGGAETWREMHGSPDGEHHLNLLRRCTYAGRPFGDEEFIVKFENQFQRNWRRWSFEKAASAA